MSHPTSRSDDTMIRHGTPPKGFSTKWTRAIHQIEGQVTILIKCISHLAATHPKIMVISVILLSVAVLGIGLLTNFNVDVNDDTLWTPAGSKPVQHMAWMDATYQLDPRLFVLMVHAASKNVVFREGVEKVFEALETVRTTPHYDQVCSASPYRTWNGTTTCQIQGVTNFWNDTRAIFETEIQSDHDLAQALAQPTFPDQRPVDLESVVGFPQLDENGGVEFGTSYVVILHVPDTPEAEAFEKDAIDNLLQLQDTFDNKHYYHVEFMAERSFDDEFARAIVTDIPLVPAVFLVMALFTVGIFAQRDPVQSRSLLGFGAVVAVLLAIMTGYGLLFVIGVPFTNMTQMLPFIMFGIGLDDAFIITGAYGRTLGSDPVQRIEDTMDAVGLSITLTTITSVLAFGLGAISSIPAVYWMCYYAFPTLFINFIYQITFVVALIVIDERRIQDRRRDCFVCWEAPPPSEEHAAVATSDEPSPSNGNNNINNQKAETEEETLEKVDSEKGHGAAAISNNGDTADEEAEMAMVDRIMLWYADKLLKTWVKGIVLVVFAAMLSGFSYSASQLTQEFKFTDVLPSDSYISEFYDAFDIWYSKSTIAPYIYFRDVDQSLPEIQEQMISYVDQYVEDNSAVADQPTFFWLRDFRAFVQYANVSNLTFYQQLDAFLEYPGAELVYGDDIIRDEEGNILASRVWLNMPYIDIDSVKNQTKIMEEQREVTKAQPINENKKEWPFFAYAPIFNIWEFYSVAVDELTITTIIGVSAVTAVAVVFIPHWTAGLFVLPLMCILYIDMLGFLQLCGAHVNAVSYITLVMSIGLLVDFVIHPLLRFYETSGTRDEKVRETLHTMGSSITIGALSTFLGIIPLGFSTSEIFNTVFIAFVGLVILGATHGLILLPVVLSLIGPVECIRENPIGAVGGSGEGQTQDKTSATFHAKTSLSVKLPSEYDEEVEV